MRCLTRIASVAALVLYCPATLFAEDGHETIVARVLPAIVQVGVASGTTDIRTVGTGIVVKDNGYILTAKHNVSGSLHVFVKLMDGTEYPVLYYIADAHRDLVLLRVIPNKALPAIEVGDSDGLKPGQETLVFGFPASSLIHGSRNTATVSHGIVSALDRELEEASSTPEAESNAQDHPTQWGTHHGIDQSVMVARRLLIKHLFQIDAMMNPGSSGGAVTTLDGRLVGICHSLISNTGSNVGINFAITINEAEMLLTVGDIKGGRANERASAGREN